MGGFTRGHLDRLRPDRLERYLRILARIGCFLVLVAETEREGWEWLCKRHWGLGL